MTKQPAHEISDTPVDWRDIRHILDNWGLCLRYKRNLSERDLYASAVIQLCEGIIDPSLLLDSDFSGESDHAFDEVMRRLEQTIPDVSVNKDYL